MTIFFPHSLNSFAKYSMSSEGIRLDQDVGHFVQTRAPHMAYVPASPGEPALLTTCLIYLLNMQYVVPRLSAISYS